MSDCKNAILPKKLPCDPGEIRTLDPLIKSQLLYQLSYGVLNFTQSMLIFLLHQTLASILGRDFYF